MPTDVVSTNFGDAITIMTAVMAVMKAKIAKTNIVNAMKPANSPAPMPNVFPKIMLAMARMIVETTAMKSDVVSVFSVMAR